jgi:CopG family nickel-responsive transcriptional regulator
MSATLAEMRDFALSLLYRRRVSRAFVDSDDWRTAKYDVNSNSSYSRRRMVKTMQRVTITIDDDLVAEIDAFMTGRGYANRSEAIRDLARSGLSQSSQEVAHDRNCVATLSYVYDHAARELPKRLTQDFHAHHGLAQATLHVHLDHDSCLEVTVLKGKSDEVKAFADRVIAERGVRHGHIAYMPADVGAYPHDHDHERHHNHGRLDAPAGRKNR